jgi:hypothetical protein
MLHPTTQQLIRKLYELTATGGLGWQPAEEDASRLETEGYVVEIAAEPPLMRLLRNDGRELERAGTEALAAVPWPGGDGTYATRIAEMASRARRLSVSPEKPATPAMSALSAPPKIPAPRSAPLPSFGRTVSFAKPLPPTPAQPPVPPAAPAKPADRAPMMSISARSVQSVEATTAADFQRAMASAVAPKPAAPAKPPGQNIYKPWN